MKSVLISTSLKIYYKPKASIILERNNKIKLHMDKPPRNQHISSGRLGKNEMMQGDFKEGKPQRSMHKNWRKEKKEGEGKRGGGKYKPKQKPTKPE